MPRRHIGTINAPPSAITAIEIITDATVGTPVPFSTGATIPRRSRPTAEADP